MSKRRLFFTEEQVYFQCQEFSCCECIDPVHTQGFTLDQLPNFRIGKLYTELRSERHIWEIISQFTNRKLGRQDDVLNAKIGVLEIYRERSVRQFGQGAGQFGHLCGLPLIMSPRSLLHDVNIDYRNRPEYSWQRRILQALRWRAIIGGLHPARRRSFPSWSWTGWSGRFEEVQYDQKDATPYTKLKKDIDCRLISIEDASGQVLVKATIELEFETHELESASRLQVEARYLTIQSAVFEMEMHPSNGASGGWKLTFPNGDPKKHYEAIGAWGRYAELTCRQEMTSHPNFYSLGRGVEVFGLVLDAYSSRFDESGRTQIPVLLLLPVKGRHFVERLDFTYLPLKYVQRAKPRQRTITIG